MFIRQPLTQKGCVWVECVWCVIGTHVVLWVFEPLPRVLRIYTYILTRRPHQQKKTATHNQFHSKNPLRYKQNQILSTTTRWKKHCRLLLVKENIEAAAEKKSTTGFLFKDSLFFFFNIEHFLSSTKTPSGAEVHTARLRQESRGGEGKKGSTIQSLWRIRKMCVQCTLFLHVPKTDEQNKNHFKRCHAIVRICSLFQEVLLLFFS